MSAKIRINITSTPGKFVFFIYTFRLKIFFFLSFLLFFICKSSVQINNKIIDFQLSYVVRPTSVTINLPFEVFAKSKLFINDFVRMRKENQILKARNNILKQMILQNQRFGYDIAELKRLLNFKENNNYQTISAKIFVSNIGSYRQNAVIDVGINDGATENQVVVSGDGLVGRVLDVNKNTANILLYSDPKSRIPIYSATSRTKAIMIGNNRDIPKIEYINGKGDIIAGEIIYTSGDGLVFPADVPIGVAVIDEDKNFFVKPFVDLSKLEFISIIGINVN